MRRFPLFLAAVAALGAPPLTAQQDETFGVWRRSCDDGVCQVFLGLGNPDTGETVASIAVVHDKAEERGSMFIELPIRVALPPGVSMEIGDFAETIPYQFCRPEGCMVIVAMSGDFVSALEAGETATLTFVRYGSGLAEAAQVPLTGFAEAYDSLK